MTADSRGAPFRGGKALSRLTTLPFLAWAGVVLAYFYANPEPRAHYDYTFRIASALLEGHLGETEPPPGWLSEIIPLEGRYYSALPLGSVLTMVPVAALKRAHLIMSFPAGAISALVAAITALFLWPLANRYGDNMARSLTLALLPLLGTWMLPNLAFAGAWQITLGVAVAGQLGALYFTLCRFRPLAAGFWFSVAFGNRTEIILLAPLFYYLIHREGLKAAGERCLRPLLMFSVFPLMLGLATLAYNHVRFGSPVDFGYARIPGVLQEPWYSDGIFSLQAIPGNAHEMLLATWRRLPGFPYLVPTGFGGSIFLSSPYLLLLFRGGARDPALKRLAWVAIVALTLVLWCHGNPGGWQLSYRYAMVLLPWMFIILQETSPRTVSPVEWTLFAASVAITAWGTWLFLRTGYVQP